MAESVFLYDGDCAFCTRCIEVYRRHAAATVRILPWQQAELDELGLTPQDCDAAVQWVRPGTAPKAGPEAIAKLLRASSGYLGLWRLLGFLLGLPPVRWAAWPAYRWVARNRHRMPGGTAACSLPRA